MKMVRVGYCLSVNPVTISKVSLCFLYEASGHKNMRVSTLSLPHGLSLLRLKEASCGALLPVGSRRVKPFKTMWVQLEQRD